MIVQVCKTVDQNLETETWNTHVGPAIGGNPPESYGTQLIDGVRKFFVTGGPYSDWLASCHRPLPVNTGGLSLNFLLKTDDKAPLVAQALEFDTRVSVAKLNYNFSSQFNYQRGGMFQISVNGKWVDTGIKPGVFIPSIWIPIQLDYAFDVVRQRYSTLAVSVNGVKSSVPTMLQNLTPTNLGWADSCSMQVQQDLNSKGGSFAMYLDGITYTWG
jgi:hypothetical protein